ncbi:MAG: hypothetical protein KJ749_09740, partial [Planctomycetes bacterium]|nr:hypothetical protein [Planctomycetota bacterium]
QARLDAARARLTQADHDLDSTRILCPFRARVESVGAYKSQVVTAPLSIATLTDMEAFEIAVGINPQDLRWLDPAIRPSTLNETDTFEGPEVTVRWSLPGQGFTWRGFVTRLERVDESTRAARMVVVVREADMVGMLAAGSSNTDTMLSIGMHCRADLPAQALPEAVLIPRYAIHDDGWVYVFEADADSPDAEIGRLGRRRVPMLRSLGEFVLVDYAGREGTDRCDLRPGEQLVISPVVRPVVGMKVRMRDSQLAAMPDFLGSPSHSLEDRLAWISGPLLAHDAFNSALIER